MRQRAIFFLFLGITLYVGSILVSDQNNTKDSVEKRYQEWQRNYTHQVETTVQALARDSLALNQCISSPIHCNFQGKFKSDREGLLIYSENNSLLYWTSSTLPSPQQLEANDILWVKDKPYLLKKIISRNDTAVYYLSAPLKTMEHSFMSDPSGQFFKVQKKPSNFPFLSSEGKALFFFVIDFLPYTGFNYWLGFTLYTLALIALFLSLFFLVEVFFKRHPIPIRTFYTILGFLSVRFITGLIFFRGINNEILSQIDGTQPGMVKLSILWINILLFYACIILITRRLTFEISKIYKKWTKLLVHGIVYLAIIASCLLVAYVGQFVIFNSSLGNNLARIGDWTVGSIASLVAFIFFIVTVFHLAWFLMKSIASIEISLPNKMLAIIASCIVSLLIYPIVSIELHPFPFYLIVILFIFLMDLFVDEEQPNLNWLFIWIAVASACSTSLLYKYHIDNINTRQEGILYIAPYPGHLVNPSPANELSFQNINLDYAVYIKGQRHDYHGEYYPLVYPYDSLIAINTLVHFHRDKRYETIYRPTEDVVIVSSRIKNSIITPISWYAYLFVIWIIITMLMAIVNTRWPFLPEDWKFRMTQFPSLRRRIQLNIMLITIGSFTSVSILSYVYLKNTAGNEVEHEARNKLSILVDDIEDKFKFTSSLSQDDLLTEILSKAGMHRVKVNIYDSRGITLYSGRSIERYRIPYRDWNIIEKAPSKITSFSDAQNKEYVSPVVNRAGVPLAYLGYNLRHNPIIGPFNNFLNTLLKLYIFLAVIALGIALIVSNSITNPLRSLADKLKEFKLGKSNQRIEWNAPDELGELIMNYNSMIDKLEASAELLAAQERDTAWREMAKQVAHEIKNPLTPMKLSIQHLQLTSTQQPEKSHKLIQQVTETLIEQIDNLARIASGFGDFAKLPSAENKILCLNNVVMHVHDLFRKREDMDIELQVPINDVLVFADKDQVSRILTNLLKNAIQAIPHEKDGHISMKLYTQKGDAIMSVTDNGTGIPDEMKSKIFEPNFTSKSSGTGLGLAMCANMVEGFNGKIRFETEVGVGTTFYVIIPLMHHEEKNRIYL